MTLYSRAMSCAVGSTWPRGGRRSTHSCSPSPMTYVRFDRPPAINSADSARPAAPSTWSAKKPRNESRSTPSGPPVVTGAAYACGSKRSGDAGGARSHGTAGALRVARHAADRHVDPEPGRSPLFLRLAAPEAVLAVLARPVAAVLQHRARGADGPGLSLAHDARLRALAGGGEEQLGAPLTRRVRRPCQWSAEDQVGDGLHGRQGRPPL